MRYDVFMSRTTNIPEWQLPEGVTRGLWEYSQAEHIAFDYDDAFAAQDLFEFDEAVINRHFDKPGVVVDLGCGTGRILIPLARRGFRTVGVDLSPHMLEVVGEKAELDRLKVDRVRGNIVELDFVADECADYSICMFSTLGMIRGSPSRRRVVENARRILKPGGLFALHVHNRWYNLFVPQGRAWVFRNWFGWLTGQPQELGDKFYNYRGIPQMFMHVFTQTELKRLLVSAGFEIVEFIALDTARRHALPHPWFFGRLRANGWIVVCRKKER